jgi:hypothetical protein
MNVGGLALRIAAPLAQCTRKGDAGKAIHRNFCKVCGTTLLTEFDVDPQHVSINACSLDDPWWLKPDHYLFTSRMQSWRKLNDGLAQYERDC